MMSRLPHAGDALGATPGHPLLIPTLSQALALSMSRQQALLTSVGIGQHPRWSPAQLFAAGEVGAWYDPSDLTTMFQDRAGTAPVTADGQTVGLILDKSQGLVLGSELVTNGTFNANTSGWTQLGAGSFVAVDGQAVLTVASGSYFAGCSITTVPGRSYEVRCTFVSKTAAAIAFFRAGTSAIGSSEYLAVSPTVAGSQLVYRLLATAATMYVSVGVNATGYVSTWDNISVKEIYGNHATAPSDAARPLKTSTGLSKWINYDAVNDVLNSTFSSSLGSSCTVCRSNVGASPAILTGQTIDTSFAYSTDHAGLIIINRALTGQETTNVTAWLTANGATA